ncbi:RNA-directed DNA polymerase from mobile element jockey [Trichonephila clavipes]|uniref:RNA-directed DNA polymerase from mobile element jockey n=1 Tax=Trichonephila clavipes TaxID=2585209 RepID=A0A8X6WH86_TRICX|nr:RNA-directed DNA polymerase from mobile element jockey [Trichonephila clavipes]
MFRFPKRTFFENNGYKPFQEKILLHQSIRRGFCYSGCPVRFNGALSESRRMWAGVPQGSVLSPLLFLIFMNTIHHHIHPDTNIACYADDIAIWHSHNDITESEKALNTTLKGIAEWAENLKLTINADKTNYCIFSTDRRHRSSFNANIKIQNSQIKKVDLPTYLGVTLDPELRFSKHRTNYQQSSWKTEYSSKAMRNFLGLKTSNPKKHFLHCYQTGFRICDPNLDSCLYFC